MKDTLELTTEHGTNGLVPAETSADYLIGPDHPTVARLVALQGNTSDNQFARMHLSCSASSWNRVKAGTYHAASGARMLEKLEIDLAAAERRLAGRGQAAEILPLQLVDLADRAVRRAFVEPRDRLVVVLAPTGGGKTTVAAHLSATHTGTVVVEASETWRSSYLAACHALLRGLGVDDRPTGTRAAESLLLHTLAEKPKLLIIDEGHYFGPATINLVKAILNQTRSTVVLLAIPALWARMKRSAWEEAEQLRSRTCAVVECRELRDADVSLYLRSALGEAWGALTAEEARDSSRAVREVANGFGLMATVARIAKEIADELGDSKARVTPGHVLAAVKTVSALRR